MENPLIVLVTVSSQEEGKEIGRQLIEDKLAACTNILPDVYSIFPWEGKVEEDKEYLLLIKTMPDRMDALIEKVETIHSYDVPEILGMPVVAGNQEYIKWVYESTRPDK